MYIQKQDYQIRIRINLLDILLENIATGMGAGETPDDILAAANKIACDTIATKAGVVYKVDEEFTKTGNDRNGYILSLALSIALYEIYQRVDDYEVPEKVIKNYNDAFESLDDISRGKEPLNLPPRDNGENANPGDDENAGTTGTGLRRFGSAKKRSHRI